MSKQQIAAIADKAGFRSRSRLWELHELYVPFDTHADSHSYETQAIARGSEAAPG